MKFLDQYLIDLAVTLAYISNNLCNPIAASNMRAAVDAKLDEIEKNPYIFSVHNWKVKHNHEYRKAKVKNYYIFFYVENNEIVIVRFIFGKMNLDKVEF